MKKLLIAGAFALSAPAAFADSCTNAQCKLTTTVGYNCSFSAVTNAADTWKVTMSYDAAGKDVIGTFSGSGENDSPMAWVSGTALFNAEKDTIFMTYSGGGGDTKVNFGAGFNPGVAVILMNGEDGADTDYNDVIANLTCMQAKPLN